MDYTEEILKVLSTELQPYSTIDGQACIDGVLTSAHKLNDLFQQKLKQCNVISRFGQVKYSAQPIDDGEGIFYTIMSDDYRIYVSEFIDECICSVVIKGEIINPQIETKSFDEAITKAHKRILNGL